jgi:dihydroorotate dehydrogenase (NAD+) catalytic subunit
MLLNASGCLDALTAPGVARSLDAFVTKTVTPLPRGGNEPVRIAETEHGMLNSIGLANPGIDVFAAEHLPQLAALGVPVWVSVGGFEADDYAGICDVLDDRHEVAVVELNLSCPNVQEAAESAAEIVAACRSRIWKPLYAKLSPAVPDIAAMAVAVAEAGADGLSLVNTIRGLALDERTLRPRLGPQAVATDSSAPGHRHRRTSGQSPPVLKAAPQAAPWTGGYSGPALKPIALAAVHACHAATGLPIVGMGGVATGRDALDLIAAGATHVALGTVLFADPDAPARIRAELAAEAAALGFPDAADAHAVAHRLPSGHGVDLLEVPLAAP